MSNTITVQNLTKAFKLPVVKTTTLFDSLLHIKRHSYHTFEALSDVSFEVEQGEFFSIVGPNGSGKSTLLRILAGIISPTSGHLTVSGTISPFLELGVGFHGELTAAQNILLTASLLGIDKPEKQLIADILAFAELEDYAEAKIKTFSSGMYIRLAYAITMQQEADVYLMDEILAVGDIDFQQKCYRTFEELKERGKTIVFVSHSLGDVSRFSDRVMVLHHGKVLTITSPKEAITQYTSLFENAQ